MRIRVVFLSTLSLRRATLYYLTPSSGTFNFYPRSPCGERLKQFVVGDVMGISIHALLAESDRSPLVGDVWACRLFLSTLSLRRATNGATHYSYIRKYFYPRSPCGERRCEMISIERCSLISIHALLAESDANKDADWVRVYVFLSTLSLRRATCYRLGRSASDWHFYPRSPCGERRWLRCWQMAARDISIHALLAESDCYRLGRSASDWHFYPRSPCGERPPRGVSCYLDNIISIHALLAESD